VRGDGSEFVMTDTSPLLFFSRLSLVSHFFGQLIFGSNAAAPREQEKEGS
jgi:hypothetical protein